MALAILFAAAACTAPGGGSGLAVPHENEIAALEAAILALDVSVDPADAARAAELAQLYPLDLATAYGITTPPLVHNTMVNMGLRPRGLCWHWAEDMEARLAEEGFRTLTLHRAIANHLDPIRIEHSTLVISARGQAMEDGIVLDAWRYGGDLFWSPVREDARYDWVEMREALRQRRALEEARAARS